MRAYLPDCRYNGRITDKGSRALRAVVVDHSVMGHLSVQEVPSVRPAPNEAFVRVPGVSLNRGEVRRAVTDIGGSRVGWALAGIVEAAAADGSGPKSGERVVGILRTGAWAERAAVPTK